MSGSECLLSPEAEFSLDDCDALLKFPWHQIKQEIPYSDLPELGTSAHLSLDGNNSFKDVRPVAKDWLSTSKLDVTTNDPKKIETCLNLNMKLQQTYIQSMAKLVDALEKNKSKQEELIRELRTEEKLKSRQDFKCTVLKPISLFAAPYFRDSKGNVPPDNEDTITKRKNLDFNAYNNPPRAWSVAEKDTLVEAVGSSALNYVLKPYMAKRDFLKTKIKDKNITDEDIVNLKKQIIYIERKMKAESGRLFKDLVEEAKDHIDWMMISATYMEGNRNEFECEILWNNFLSPSVNKEKFTDKEDDKLRKLVKKYKGKNWEAVAEELKTNRSAIQVFERYQVEINKNLRRKYWTPEEDELLMKLVKQYRIGKYINWNKVKLDGRTRWQIINRYDRTLSEDIRRDPWTPAEDAMLYACVSKFKCKWTKMQEFFIGRPLYNLRERYVNTLDPDLRMGNWTREEDEQLIKLLKKHGYGNWSQISQDLTGRTDNMVYCRTKRLIIRSLEYAKDDNIEWECPNVQQLTSVLKPVAYSKNCITMNTRLQKTHSIARETLASAVSAIAHKIEEKIDLETLDFTAASLPTLRMLCTELGSLETQTKDVKEFTPKYFHRQKPTNRPLCRTRRKRQCKVERDYERNDTDDDDDDEQFDEIESEEVEIKVEDGGLTEIQRVWLNKCVDNFFEEEAYVLYHNDVTRKKGICINKRAAYESQMYLNYLQKALGCKTHCIDDEDIDSDDEYNIAIMEVIDKFIQPFPSEDQRIVLPPNLSTLHGMEMMLLLTPRIKVMMNFVDHSLPYILYVTGFESDLPICVACSKDVNSKAHPIRSTFSEVVTDMQANLLAVTDSLQRQVKVETRVIEGEPVCRCQELLDSKKDVDLLILRFVGMFLWPYMLANIGLTEEQEKLVYYEKKKPVPYVKKRVQPSPKKSPEPKKYKPMKIYGLKGPSTSRPYVKRERVSPVDMPRKKKVYIKKEPTSEPDDITPTRRSPREAVRNRKSFAKIKIESESEEE